MNAFLARRPLLIGLLSLGMVVAAVSWFASETPAPKPAGARATKPGSEGKAAGQYPDIADPYRIKCFLPGLAPIGLIIDIDRIRTSSGNPLDAQRNTPAPDAIAFLKDRGVALGDPKKNFSSGGGFKLDRLIG
jgi:hypothetical protein